MAIKVANNNSLSAITSLPAAVSGGAMTLLETQTASSSATISFTSNIDSSYDEYIFKWYDIHPSGDGANFTFQGDTGTNTSYNQTMTTTMFRSEHDEAGSSTDLSYRTGGDQAQGTAFQDICSEVGNGNDESCAGTLTIYAPSDTTFVKHWIAVGNSYKSSDASRQTFTAGYFNITTALTRFQFKMSSGTIDAGTIKMYGVS